MTQRSAAPRRAPPTRAARALAHCAAAGGVVGQAGAGREAVTTGDAEGVVERRLRLGYYLILILSRHGGGRGRCRRAAPARDVTSDRVLKDVMCDGGIDKGRDKRRDKGLIGTVTADVTRHVTRASKHGLMQDK